MRVVFLIWIPVIFYCANAHAQVKLEVRDLESNKPLEGATVRIHEKNAILISSKDGLVDAADLQEGDHLTISFVGYTTKDLVLQENTNMVYLQPDYQLLNALTVVGQNNEQKLSDIAGSYAITPRLAIDRFNDESLVRSMNTLPGIRIEERSPSSYRVSIRGSLLRAPYGVRNVKVYWNNIPYTDPTGSTPLNLLDLNNIGKVETIKGPAGSIYGAGIGGVLNIYSEVSQVKPLSADIGYTAGSYGFHKVSANLNTASENHRFTINYARQRGDGYRDHSSFDRGVMQVGGSFYTTEKRIIKAQVLYSDLFYQLPGGLTKEQYNENPRQARPGAADKNTSIDHQNFLLGIIQDYEWNDKISNSTSVYYSNGMKENPFINNYELERLSAFGGRSSFNISTKLGTIPTTLNTGVELNYGDFHASNHGNVDGHADTLRYEDELKSLNSFAFIQVDMHLSEKWSINVGASLNYLRYDINRLEDVALDTSYQLNRTFNPEFIPRIGVVVRLTKGLAIHGSISSGFSPPTTEELRTSDGGINTDLEAEKGINYELGIRGNSANSKFYYDITSFWMQQKETIVSKTTETGTVIFENAGSTSQLGLEALIGYSFINDPAQTISLIKLQTAYTHHNFIFQDYVKRSLGENVDYSGNDLTGTAPNISVTTFDLESKRGFYFNATFNFTDQIPLNDANTVFGDSYNLITLKTGWRIKMNKKHLVDVFLGVDNLLNEKYSLGNDLNAFGQRYYNTSPERNYFGGIKVYFNKL